MDASKSRCAGCLALLELTLLATGIFPASADQITVHHPNDSPSSIDVARIVQGHYFRYALYWRVAHEAWDTAALDNGRVILSLNTDNDADVERRAFVEYKGGAARSSDRESKTATGAGSGEPYCVDPVAARWKYG